MTDRPVECQNCHKRPGTLSWVGEGGSLAMVHGMSVLWCEFCVLSAQIKYAKDLAKGIPELEKKLRELE